MKGTLCEEEARAICKFCGRGVSSGHIQEKRFATGFTSIGGVLGTDNAFSIDDAVWCGACNPKYNRST